MPLTTKASGLTGGELTLSAAHWGGARIAGRQPNGPW